MGLGRQCSDVLACGSFLLLGYNLRALFLVFPQTRTELNSGQARIVVFRRQYQVRGTIILLYMLHVVVVTASVLSVYCSRMDIYIYTQYSAFTTTPWLTTRYPSRFLRSWFSGFSPRPSVIWPTLHPRMLPDVNATPRSANMLDLFISKAFS
jgi:hypothetical protein